MPFKTKNSKFCLKIISTWLLVCLLVNQAAGAIPENSIPANSPAKISIPPSLGTVQESFIPAMSPDLWKGRLLFHIQDAHGVPDAQKNIEALLDYLASHYGMNRLYLEGAVGRLEPERFRFASRERNEKVWQKLFNDAVLSGAELYLLRKDRAGIASGVEEEAPYAENLRLFRKVMASAGASEEWTQTLYGRLDLAASRILKPGTREIFQKWWDFEDQHAGLLDFIKLLLKNSGQGADFETKPWKYQAAWPHLSRLIALQSLEHEFDFEKIAHEKEDFLKQLKNEKINPALIAQLEKRTREKAKDFKNGDSRTLFEKIFEALGDRKLSLSSFPHFLKWARYRILSEEIKAVELEEETERFARKIVSGQAETQEQKNILKLFCRLILLKKTFKLELSRREWARVQRDKKMLHPVSISKNLNQLLAGKRDVKGPRFARPPARGMKPRAGTAPGPRAKPGAPSAVAPLALDYFEKAGAVLGQAIDFYEKAVERDSILIHHTLEDMEKNRAEKAVLITGGFHGEGIKEILKQKGIAYVQITPAMGGETSPRAYVDRMMHSHVAIPAALQGEAVLRRLGEWDYIADRVAEAKHWADRPVPEDQAAIRRLTYPKAASLGESIDFIFNPQTPDEQIIRWLAEVRFGKPFETGGMQIAFPDREKRFVLKSVRLASPSIEEKDRQRFASHWLTKALYEWARFYMTGYFGYWLKEQGKRMLVALGWIGPRAPPELSDGYQIAERRHPNHSIRFREISLLNPSILRGLPLGARLLAQKNMKWIIQDYVPEEWFIKQKIKNAVAAGEVTRAEFLLRGAIQHIVSLWRENLVDTDGGINILENVALTDQRLYDTVDWEEVTDDENEIRAFLETKQNELIQIRNSRVKRVSLRQALQTLHENIPANYLANSAFRFYSFLPESAADRLAQVFLEEIQNHFTVENWQRIRSESISAASLGDEAAVEKPKEKEIHHFKFSQVGIEFVNGLNSVTTVTPGEEVTVRIKVPAYLRDKIQTPKLVTDLPGYNNLPVEFEKETEAKDEHGLDVWSVRLRADQTGGYYYMPYVEINYDHKTEIFWAGNEVDNPSIRVLPKWATQGLNTAIIFIKTLRRPGTDQNRFGTFTDLKWYLKDLKLNPDPSKRIDLNAALLLPFTDSFGDSPYEAISPYAIHPKHIDWDEVRYENGRTPDGRPLETKEEKFKWFKERRAQSDMEFQDFLNSPVFENLWEYADVKAIFALRGPQDGPAQDSAIRAKSEYHELVGSKENRQDFGFFIYEQYIALKQLRETVKYIYEELGIRLGFDIPFYPSDKGALAFHHPEDFKWEGGNIAAPRYTKGHPAHHQTWFGQGVWNYEKLRQLDYEPILAPFRYWRDMGFFMGRWDAAHMGPHDLHRAMNEKFIRGRDFLLIPEQLGGTGDGPNNDRLSLLKNGGLLYHNPEYEATNGYEGLVGTVIWHKDDYHFRVSSTHDSPRMIYIYRNVGGPPNSMEEERLKMLAIHRELAFLQEGYTFVQGDERGHGGPYQDDMRINIPLTAEETAKGRKEWHWDAPSPAEVERYDLREFIGKFLRIRKEHPVLRKPGTLHYLNNSQWGKVSSFLRLSGDEAILVVNNLSSQTQQGEVYFSDRNEDFRSMQKLGFPPDRPFRLTNLEIGEEMEFTPGHNTLRFRLEPGQAYIFDLKQIQLLEPPPPVTSAPAAGDSLDQALVRSIPDFISFDPSGKPALYAGGRNTHFGDQEWGRDFAISMIGLAEMARHDETIHFPEGDKLAKDVARDLIKRWAGIDAESRAGMDPHDRRRINPWHSSGDVMYGVINWYGDYNRNTVDAPLWFVEAVFQYVDATGDTDLLNEIMRDGLTLLQILNDIIDRYAMSRDEEFKQRGIEPKSIRMDEKTGFILVPRKKYTWMDTDFTERQGYSVEIQGLWFNALNRFAQLAEKINSGNPKILKAREIAAKVQQNFPGYFWNEEGKYFYDSLGTDGVMSADESVQKGWRDGSNKPNQLFAVYFGLVQGEKAIAALQAIEKELLIPGALRSLSPKAPYYRPDFEAAEREGRHKNAAYHSGMGWVWLYPFYYMAAVEQGMIRPDEAQARMKADLEPIVQHNPRHSLPELLSGEAYSGIHARRGPEVQSWSVMAAIAARRKIQDENHGATAASLGLEYRGTPRSIESALRESLGENHYDRIKDKQLMAEILHKALLAMEPAQLGNPARIKQGITAAFDEAGHFALFDGGLDLVETHSFVAAVYKVLADHRILSQDKKNTLKRYGTVPVIPFVEIDDAEKTTRALEILRSIGNVTSYSPVAATVALEQNENAFSSQNWVFGKLHGIVLIHTPAIEEGMTRFSFFEKPKWASVTLLVHDKETGQLAEKHPGLKLSRDGEEIIFMPDPGKPEGFAIDETGHARHVRPIKASGQSLGQPDQAAGGGLDLQALADSLGSAEDYFLEKVLKLDLSTLNLQDNSFTDFAFPITDANRQALENAFRNNNAQIEAKKKFRVFFSGKMPYAMGLEKEKIYVSLAPTELGYFGSRPFYESHRSLLFDAQLLHSGYWAARQFGSNGNGMKGKHLVFSRNSSALVDEDVIVFPGVYHPWNDRSSQAMIEAMTDEIKPGMKVYIVGLGSGFDARYAARLGASVQGVDLNGAALPNTFFNFESAPDAAILLPRLLKATHAPMFEDLTEGKDFFDRVFFNMPSDDSERQSQYHFAFRDSGWAILRSFLLNSPKFLKPGGKVVFVHGTPQAVRQKARQLEINIQERQASNGYAIFKTTSANLRAASLGQERQITDRLVRIGGKQYWAMDPAVAGQWDAAASFLDPQLRPRIPGNENSLVVKEDLLLNFPGDIRPPLKFSVYYDPAQKALKAVFPRPGKSPGIILFPLRADYSKGHYPGIPLFISEAGKTPVPLTSTPPLAVAWEQGEVTPEQIRKYARALVREIVAVSFLKSLFPDTAEKNFYYLAPDKIGDALASRRIYAYQSFGGDIPFEIGTHQAGKSVVDMVILNQKREASMFVEIGKHRVEQVLHKWQDSVRLLGESGQFPVAEELYFYVTGLARREREVGKKIRYLARKLFEGLGDEFNIQKIHILVRRNDQWVTFTKGQWAEQRQTLSEHLKNRPLYGILDELSPLEAKSLGEGSSLGDEMEQSSSILLPKFGKVLVPAEYQHVIAGRAPPVVHRADAEFRRILASIAAGMVIVLTGKYAEVRRTYNLLASHQNELIKAGQFATIPALLDRRRAEQSAKRSVLSRLMVVARHDSLLKIFQQPDLGNLAQKFSIHGAVLNGQPFLLPVKTVLGIAATTQRLKQGFYVPALDKRIVVLPEVLVPADHRATTLIAKNLVLKDGDVVLDMGSGTGVLALIAAQKVRRQGLKKVKIYATDLNPQAVENIRANVERFGYQDLIEVRGPGSLFDTVKGLKFDVILFNPPWLPGDPKRLLDHAIYDKDFAVITQFLAEARDYLKEGGRILLEYSDYSDLMGHPALENLKRLIETNHLTIARKKFMRPQTLTGAPRTDKKAKSAAKQTIFLYDLRPAQGASLGKQKPSGDSAPSYALRALGDALPRTEKPFLVLYRPYLIQFLGQRALEAIPESGEPPVEKELIEKLRQASSAEEILEPLLESQKLRDIVAKNLAAEGFINKQGRWDIRTLLSKLGREEADRLRLELARKDRQSEFEYLLSALGFRGLGLAFFVIALAFGAIPFISGLLIGGILYALGMPGVEVMIKGGAFLGAGVGLVFLPAIALLALARARIEHADQFKRIGPGDEVGYLVPSLQKEVVARVIERDTERKKLTIRYVHEDGIREAEVAAWRVRLLPEHLQVTFSSGKETKDENDIAALQILRGRLGDTSFYLSLYEPVSDSDSETQEYRLVREAFPKSFLSTIPKKIQVEIQTKVFSLLPATFQVKVQFIPRRWSLSYFIFQALKGAAFLFWSAWTLLTDIRHLFRAYADFENEWKSMEEAERFKDEIWQHLPVIKMHDAINKMIQEFKPGTGKHLTWSEKANLVQYYHATYDIQGGAYPVFESLKQLKENGFIRLGTRVAVLNMGRGLAVHLFNSVGLRAAGFETDPKLFQDAQTLHEELARRGAIDKRKAQIDPRDYLDPAVDLPSFDILYLKPSYAEGTAGPGTLIGSVTEHTVQEILARMKPGAILVVEGLDGRKPRLTALKEDPGVEYIKKLGAFRKVQASSLGMEEIDGIADDLNRKLHHEALDRLGPFVESNRERIGGDAVFNRILIERVLSRFAGFFFAERKDGRLLEKANRFEGILTGFIAALTPQVMDQWTRDKLTYTLARLATYYRYQNQYEAAIEVSKKALELDPGEYHNLFNAVAAYDSLRVRNKQSDDLIKNWAHYSGLFFRQVPLEDDTARRFTERALEHIDSMAGSVLAHAKESEWAPVLESLREGLIAVMGKIEPHDFRESLTHDIVRAASRISQYYRTQDKHEQALAVTEAALKLRSQDPYVLFDQAKILLDLDRPMEAKDIFEKILYTAPPDFDLSKTLTNYSLLGTELLARKRTDDAIAVFERVLSMQPENQGAQFYLALAYSREGVYEKALDLLEKAIAPENSELYLNANFYRFYLELAMRIAEPLARAGTADSQAHLARLKQSVERFQQIEQKYGTPVFTNARLIQEVEEARKRLPELLKAVDSAAAKTAPDQAAVQAEKPPAVQRSTPAEFNAVSVRIKALILMAKWGQKDIDKQIGRIRTDIASIQPTAAQEILQRELEETLRQIGHSSGASLGEAEEGYRFDFSQKYRRIIMDTIAEIQAAHPESIVYASVAPLSSFANDEAMEGSDLDGLTIFYQGLDKAALDQYIPLLSQRLENVGANAEHYGLGESIFYADIAWIDVDQVREVVERATVLGGGRLDLIKLDQHDYFRIIRVEMAGRDGNFKSLYGKPLGLDEFPEIKSDLLRGEARRILQARAQYQREHPQKRAARRILFDLEDKLPHEKVKQLYQLHRAGLQKTLASATIDPDLFKMLDEQKLIKKVEHSSSTDVYELVWFGTQTRIKAASLGNGNETHRLASGREIPKSLPDELSLFFISAEDLRREDYFGIRVYKKGTAAMTDEEFAAMDYDDLTSAVDDSQFHDYQIRLDDHNNLFVEHEPWDEAAGTPVRWAMPAYPEAFHLVVFDIATARQNWRRIHEIVGIVQDWDDQDPVVLSSYTERDIRKLKIELSQLRGDILSIQDDTADKHHGFLVRRLDPDPDVIFEIFYTPSGASLGEKPVPQPGTSAEQPFRVGNGTDADESLGVGNDVEAESLGDEPFNRSGMKFGNRIIQKWSEDHRDRDLGYESEGDEVESAVLGALVPALLRAARTGGKQEATIPILSVGDGSMAAARLLSQQLKPSFRFPITIVEPAISPETFAGSRLAATFPDLIHISKPIEDVQKKEVKQPPKIIYASLAFEYTNRDKTLKVLRRLAAPDAKFIFVLHHDQSLIAKTRRFQFINFKLAINFLNLVKNFVSGTITLEKYRQEAEKIFPQMSDDLRHATQDYSQQTIAAVRTKKDMIERDVENKIKEMARNYLNYAAQYAPFEAKGDVSLKKWFKESELSREDRKTLESRFGQIFGSEDEIREYFEHRGFKIESIRQYAVRKKTGFYLVEFSQHEEQTSSVPRAKGASLGNEAEKKVMTDIGPGRVTGDPYRNGYGALVQDMIVEVEGGVEIPYTRMLKGYDPVNLARGEKGFVFNQELFQDVMGAEFWPSVFDRISPDGKVLDLSSARGRHFSGLGEQELSRITAFDYMQSFLTELQQKFPSIHVQQGDWVDMKDFADQSFEAITGLNALTYTHSEEELRQVLKEIDRVLKPSPDGKKFFMHLTDRDPMPGEWYGPGYEDALKLSVLPILPSGSVPWFMERSPFSRKARQNFLQTLTRLLESEFGYRVEPVHLVRSKIVKATPAHEALQRQMPLANVFIDDPVLGVFFGIDETVPPGYVKERIELYGIRAEKNAAASLGSDVSRAPTLDEVIQRALERLGEGVSRKSEVMTVIYVAGGFVRPGYPEDRVKIFAQSLEPVFAMLEGRPAGNIQTDPAVKKTNQDVRWILDRPFFIQRGVKPISAQDVTRNVAVLLDMKVLANSTEDQIKRLAENLKQGDLVLAFWNGEGKGAGNREKPRALSELIKFLSPKGIRVSDIFSQNPSSNEIKRGIPARYDQGILVSGTKSAYGDLQVSIETDRFRFDTDQLLQAGLDPNQAVALLRQIAEVSDKTKRFDLYTEVLGAASFDATSNFWLVGANLIDFIKRMSAEDDATKTLSRAA